MGTWNTLLQLFMLLPCLTALVLPNNNASDERGNNAPFFGNRTALVPGPSVCLPMAPPGRVIRGFGSGERLRRGFRGIWLVHKLCCHKRNL